MSWLRPPRRQRPALPDELWLRVLQYCDPPTLLRACRVSDQLHKLGRSAELWQAHFTRLTTGEVRNIVLPAPLTTDLCGLYRDAYNALDGIPEEQLAVEDPPTSPFPMMPTLSPQRHLGHRRLLGGPQSTRRADPETRPAPTPTPGIRVFGTMMPGRQRDLLEQRRYGPGAPIAAPECLSPPFPTQNRTSHPDQDGAEFLSFRLQQPICLVRQVRYRYYQAKRAQGRPIFAARHCHVAIGLDPGAPPCPPCACTAHR
jgi:hypothetical protein